MATSNKNFKVKNGLDVGGATTATSFVKDGGTASQFLMADGTVLTGVTITYNVTNDESGAYLINGSSNPTLSFIRGHRYAIKVNATGHPFWIQTVSGAYSSGNIYSSGVTNNGTESGTIIIDVPFDAPQLYYACQYHSSMAGSITVSSLGPTGPYSTLLIIEKTASHTLVLSDKDKLIEMNSASANTLTVPLNSSEAFPIGSQLNILQTGAGQTTIAPVSGSVTINATPGLKLRAQWSSATLIKRAENVWVIAGDLVL